MLVIACPNCGPRNSDEFAYQDEIIPRPTGDIDPGTWRRYLYFKDNVSGWHRERWFHVSGCRRFLDIDRNTESNEIRNVTPVGART